MSSTDVPTGQSENSTATAGGWTEDTKTESWRKGRPFRIETAYEDEFEKIREELSTICGSFKRSSRLGSASRGLDDKDTRELLRSIEWGGLNLFDHLRNMMALIVATRPGNTIDFFDQYSRSLREPKGIVNPINFLPFAHRFVRMATQVLAPESNRDSFESASVNINIKLKRKVVCSLELADYFEDMDVAVPRIELEAIDVALKKLIQTEGIKDVRFWGKIFGLEKIYIVAECSLTYEEIQRRVLLEVQGEGEEGEGEEEQESVLDQPVFGFGTTSLLNIDEEDEILFKKLHQYRMPPLPMPEKKPKTKMMPERTGEGANKKVYYVCNEPGEMWVPLANVKPEHIVAARKIRKYLTGRLQAEVVCYPPFPGTEREYLRAQIARISAGTEISPLGFYQFGSEDEMGEAGEGAEDGGLVENLEFDPIPFKDILTPEFWVHHSPHILRIGRTTYYTPPKQAGEEGEEPPMEEEENERMKEIGPALLTPISEDMSLDGVEPWTMKRVSRLLPGSGVVGVRSNLWPGAFAFCKGRVWGNIYLGMGLKAGKATGFTPAKFPRPLAEYPTTESITEVLDPTPEEEEAWRKAHLRPKVPLFFRGGEAGEEGEEAPFYEEPEPDD